MLKSKSTFRQKLIDRMGGTVEQCQVSTELGVTTYLSAGVGDPVILLHGAGAGAVTWYPSMATVSEGFRVIAPDVVGYGESDKPDATYDRPFFASWLKKFFDALEIEQAHVVGLSQGGAIALQFALENPSLVKKLVLVNSGALGARPSFWPMLSMILMNAIPSEVTNRFNARYLLVDPENRDPNHVLYSIEVLRKPGGKNAFSQGRGAAVSPMSAGDLCKIQNQTLIIWGGNDQLFPVEQVMESITVMPNVTLREIDCAGHLPLMDQTSTFNDTLVSFLNSQESVDA